MSEPKLPQPFFVSEPAFRDWLGRAAAGEDLQWALAAFLPRGNAVKALTLELAEAGFINLVQRPRRIEGSPHRQFAYIAVRTSKPLPPQMVRKGAR